MSRLACMLLAGGILAVMALGSCRFRDDAKAPERVPYSVFQRYLDTGQITQASVGPDDIDATLRNGQAIVTAHVPPDIADELERHGAQFSGRPGLDSGSVNWLAWLFPVPMMLPILLLMTNHGRLGAHVRKSVLLVGPRGTGKTLLARTVAGEAGVPSCRSTGRNSSSSMSVSAPRECGTCSSRVGKWRRRSS